MTHTAFQIPTIRTGTYSSPTTTKSIHFLIRATSGLSRRMSRGTQVPRAERHFSLAVGLGSADLLHDRHECFPLNWFTRSTDCFETANFHSARLLRAWGSAVRPSARLPAAGVDFTAAMNGMIRQERELAAGARCAAAAAAIEFTRRAASALRGSIGGNAPPQPRENQIKKRNARVPRRFVGRLNAPTLAGTLSGAASRSL
jgi:hypothetical protein